MPPSSHTAGVICVVDDETSVLDSIKQLFESDDLSALTFNDPATFLDYASGHAVALAVLDLWMPGMSGLEVQQQLNAHSPDTRVIVMTGRDDPTVRAAALHAGAVAFLTKPFDDSVFLAAVHQALRPAA